MANQIKQDAWWQSFYEDTPFELYLARTDAAELEETIAFLRDKLKLVAGATIFDQCCGLGGMSIPLAKLGFRIIGADLCAKYIGMAKAEAAAQKLWAEFHEADAFEFLPDVACDAAFNWYTSFGYAEEDSQNLKMIARAFEALKPGGRFALDFLNMPMIMASFKEEMSTVLKSASGDIIQTRHCTHDLVRGTMDQDWTWTTPDGKVLTQKSTLRAYMPVDLLRLFSQAGFTETQLFGGCDSSPVTAESGRCIVIGRKPL